VVEAIPVDVAARGPLLRKLTLSIARTASTGSLENIDGSLRSLPGVVAVALEGDDTVTVEYDVSIRRELGQQADRR